MAKHILSTHVLHGIAKTAFARIDADVGDSETGQNDALVAVLFAAATLEAYMSELELMTDSGRSVADGFQYLEVLGDVLREAEISRASIRQKFLLTKHILPGSPYDKESQLYEDFDLLFKIRDRLVHPKPENLDELPRFILRPLEAKGLIKREGPGVCSGWSSRICTRAVARWACNVVVDMIMSLRDCFPANAESSADTAFFMSTFAHYERV